MMWVESVHVEYLDKNIKQNINAAACGVKWPDHPCSYCIIGECSVLQSMNAYPRNTNSVHHKCTVFPFNCVISYEDVCVTSPCVYIFQISNTVKQIFELTVTNLFPFGYTISKLYLIYIEINYQS